MGFYDESNNVDRYIDMCADYDGSHLYEALKKQLKEGSSVLELGTGPGFDIPFLKSHYQVTGSDLSHEFLKRCQTTYPDLNFIKLDALNMDISSAFNCIYSNKVLHHLTENELKQSLTAQAKRLNKDGLIAHAFWIGDEDKEMEGLLFTYYQQEQLLDIISQDYEVLSTLSYGEFEDGDSLFVIAKLRS